MQKHNVYGNYFKLVRQKKGFGLLEVLVSLVIVMIISAIVLSTVLFIQRQPIINEIRLKAMNHLLNTMTSVLVSNNQSYPINRTFPIQLSNGEQLPIKIFVSKQSGSAVIKGEATWTFGKNKGKVDAALLKE